MTTTTNTTGHDTDCMCGPCMTADMDATIAANGLNPADYPAYLVNDSKPSRGDGNGNGSSRPSRSDKATDKQIAYLRSLIDGAECDAEASHKAVDDAITAGTMTKQVASSMIDIAKQTPKRVRKPAQSESAETITDGM